MTYEHINNQFDVMTYECLPLGVICLKSFNHNYKDTFCKSMRDFLMWIVFTVKSTAICKINGSFTKLYFYPIWIMKI